MAKDTSKNTEIKTPQNTEYKTTDKVFEMGYYNKKGYLNKGRVFSVVGGIFGATFLASNIVESEILYKFIENIPLKTFIDLDNQIKLLSNLPSYHYDEIMSNFPNGEFKFNKASWDSLLSLTTSLMASSYLATRKFNSIKFKAGIQESLSSMNLSQYYMEKAIVNKSGNYTFIFKLQKGENMNYDGFLNNAENLQQLFGVGKFKTGRVEKNKIILSFYDLVPELQFFYKGKQYTIDEKIDMVSDGIPEKSFDTKTTCKRIDFKDSLGENKSLLGVQDIKGKPLYALFPSTVGVIQGHTLIAGGTGSGKSFLSSSWVKTWFIPENYKNIDTVFVINMKEGSRDWHFLKGIEKVVMADITDGMDAVLNVLKLAQLKMIANNRDNGLIGDDNTEYGQCLVIIDEIHKFKMIENDSSQTKVIKEKAKKGNWIIDEFATQSRSANLFVIAIVQKPSKANLPEQYREQISNGVLLRADPFTSSIIIDEDRQKKEGIIPTTLSPGKFFYINYDTSVIREGFAVPSVKEWDIDKINKYEETEKLIKGRERTEALMDLAVIVAELKFDEAKAEEENKDFKEDIGKYNIDRKNIEESKRDYWGEAKVIFDKQNGIEANEVSTNENVLEENQNNLQNILNYSNSEDQENIDNLNTLIETNEEEQEEDEVFIGGEVKINFDTPAEEIIETKIGDKEELEEKSPVSKNSFMEKLKANKINSEKDLEEEKEKEQEEKDLEEYDREQDEKEEKEFDKLEELIKTGIEQLAKEEIITLKEEDKKEFSKFDKQMDLLDSL